MLIIAVILLGFSGCGYKANPYYEVQVPIADENVEFIIKKSSNDTKENNTSCE